MSHIRSPCDALVLKYNIQC